MDEVCLPPKVLEKPLLSFTVSGGSGVPVAASPQPLPPSSPGPSSSQRNTEIITIYGVTTDGTPLQWHPTAMAPHSSTLAWKIPWTEELGRLQSMGSHRVGHD